MMMTEIVQKCENFHFGIACVLLMLINVENVAVTTFSILYEIMAPFPDWERFFDKMLEVVLVWEIAFLFSVIYRNF